MADELDTLYSLPLEEFTAARNALAKELRGRADREQADEVKALRKPSQAAWALNQAARSSPGGVGRLLQAGRQLRRKQEEVLSGDASPADLRRCVDAEREAVAGLLSEAAAAIGTPSAAVTERMRETLHAASADEEVATRLREGRLVEDHRAVGLGPGAAAPAKRGKASPTRKASPTKKASRIKKAPRTKKAAAPTEPRRARNQRTGVGRAARAALQKAERAAERASREAAAAEHDLGRAEVQFRAAERAAKEAKSKLEAAEAELARARAGAETAG